MQEEAKLIKDRKAPAQKDRLLNHRVHFVSLRQEAEDHAPRIAHALQVPNVSAVAEMLEWFGSVLLGHAARAMETATQKAINEAVSLIRDPDYHQTVKERRRRERGREQARQQEEREKRKNPPKPTLEEVQGSIHWAKKNLAQYEDWTAKSVIRLAELEKVEAELLSEVEAQEIVM